MSDSELSLEPNRLVILEQLKGGAHAEYLLRIDTERGSTELKVKRQRRKSMGIYVDKHRLTELRVPTWCPWTDIQLFLEEKTDWILDSEAELAKIPFAPRNEYVNGGRVMYLGRQLSLDLIRSRFKMTALNGDVLTVSCSDPSKPHLVEKQVDDWYRRQADRVFEDRLKSLNMLFLDHHEPTGLVVRKMKSRWGSCAANGEICLNLLLIRECLPQIDFVVAHELCHLRHFRHNAAFYALLDEVMPDWRSREGSLGRAA